MLAAVFAPLKSALERVVARRFKVSVAPGSAAWAAPATSGPIASGQGEDLESMIRRVVREELRAVMPPRDGGGSSA